MNLFKNRKEKKLADGQEKLAESIAGQILKTQRKFADYLNHKSSTWTNGTWKLFLLILCLAFGSYCLHLLWQAFN